MVDQMHMYRINGLITCVCILLNDCFIINARHLALNVRTYCMFYVLAINVHPDCMSYLWCYPFVWYTGTSNLLQLECDVISCFAALIASPFLIVIVSYISLFNNNNNNK